MKIKKIPLIFCILALLAGIFSIYILESFLITPNTDGYLEILWIIIVSSVLAFPAFTCFYSILCIQNPDVRNIKAMTACLFVYPVIICAGAGSSAYREFGFSLSLFLSTLIAVFARIELCRFLIKHQGLQQEPRVKFWSSGINRTLAFLLFMCLSCFLGTNFRPSAKQPFTLLIPLLILIIPILLYKMAESLRKYIQRKCLSNDSSTFTENT